MAQAPAPPMIPVAAPVPLVSPQPMPLYADAENLQPYPQTYPAASTSPSAFIPGPYGAQPASPYQEQLQQQPSGAYRGAPEV